MCESEVLSYDTMILSTDWWHASVKERDTSNSACLWVVLDGSGADISNWYRQCTASTVATWRYGHRNFVLCWYPSCCVYCDFARTTSSQSLPSVALWWSSKPLHTYYNVSTGSCIMDDTRRYVVLGSVCVCVLFLFHYPTNGVCPRVSLPQSAFRVSYIPECVCVFGSSHSTVLSIIVW